MLDEHFTETEWMGLITNKHGLHEQIIIKNKKKYICK